MSLEILKPDNGRWDEIFRRLPSDRQDVFYGRGFAALCQESIHSDHEIRCLGWIGRNDTVALYPFVRRDLGQLTGLAELAGLYDITSLYGRGGIVWSGGNEDELAKFHREILAWAEDADVICAFDRYHPIFSNQNTSLPATAIKNVGGFVVVDLYDDIDAVEARYKYSVRKDIRKSEAANIQTFVENNLNNLDAFLEIYRGTLDRRQAKHFYYFERAFFERLTTHMDGQFLFIHASVDGQIVSTELVLTFGQYAHSFLGGTLHDAQILCPNHRLKRDLIRVLKKLGYRYFLLGGGTKENDGIFRYKLSFSPTGVFPSQIGGLVLDAPGYDHVKSVCLAAGRAFDWNRFQFYDLD